MGLLLYKSDEMFSATQLIRQSKMIFDKVVKNEIEKAIILRDGKPGFLLMDFTKYEKIMGDYEKLKKQVEKLKKSKSQSSTTQEKVEKIIKKPAPKIVEENKPEEIVPQKILTPKKEDIDDIQQNTQTVEQEIAQAMKSIDAMNFDDNMKATAKEKIRNKIIQARKEREKLLDEQSDYEQEQLKKELELQAKVQKEKQKKERELREFWD